MEGESYVLTQVVSGRDDPECDWRGVVETINGTCRRHESSRDNRLAKTTAKNLLRVPRNFLLEHEANLRLRTTPRAPRRSR